MPALTQQDTHAVRNLCVAGCLETVPLQLCSCRVGEEEPVSSCPHTLPSLSQMCLTCFVLPVLNILKCIECDCFTSIFICKDCVDGTADDPWPGIINMARSQAATRPILFRPSVTVTQRPAQPLLPLCTYNNEPTWLLPCPPEYHKHICGGSPCYDSLYNIRLQTRPKQLLW